MAVSVTRSSSEFKSPKVDLMPQGLAELVERAGCIVFMTEETAVDDLLDTVLSRDK